MNPEQYYPFTPVISQKLRKARLTAAEWRFWAYLIEIDPWGDRYKDIDPMTIMAECEMSKPTYYRAKAKFQELGLFDFQEEKVSFRNLTGVSKMRQPSQKRDSKSQKRDSESQKRDSESQKRENRSSKPAPRKTSKVSQTYSDYSDFLNSLSEAERESFLNFCQEKAKAMPRPPQLVDAWIAKHYLDLHKQFVSSATGRAAKQEAIAQQHDWKNDPRFDEWLKISYWEGMNWVQASEAEREERWAFYQWAQSKNIYEGVDFG